MIIFFYLYTLSKITMDNENYISPNKITKQYDITSGTLRRWAETGKIRCLRPNGGKRIYNVEDIKKIFNKNENTQQVNNTENDKNELANIVKNLKLQLESNQNIDCIDNFKSDLDDIKVLLEHMEKSKKM